MGEVWRSGASFQTTAAFGEKVATRWPSRKQPGDRFLGWAGVGPGLWRGSKGGIVEIESGGQMQLIDIDAEKGPRIPIQGGSGKTTWMCPDGSWPSKDSVDQKLLAYQAAKLVAEEKRMAPEYERLAQERMLAIQAEAEVRKMESFRDDVFAKMRSGASVDEVTKARCKMEMARPAVRWAPIGPEQVTNNHANRSPGVIYGLDFPWSADLLEEYGPAWLTSAFHAACTLAKDNKVVSLKIERSVTIDAGNNAGKFLFEVTYQREQAGLHNLLFAKVPFAMTPETQSDRISSSVYKQPMDLQEINTYRLLEAAFPCKTPRFYYGDISNETSNFILITERIPYAEIGKPCSDRPLAPFEVEGPYDKCKDALQLLRRPPREYYKCLIEYSARIAGQHKAGNMCSEQVLADSLRTVPADPKSMQAWGANKDGATGEPPGIVKGRLGSAVKFFGSTAKVVFPKYAETEAFQDRFTKAMMTWSAYSAEIQYWLHHNLDYVALGHNNLNSDNAYFWRDETGKLDCGLIDWGGFGVGPLGHKMWWTFNCADFEQTRDNLDEYIDQFLATYSEYGGPSLDADVFRMQVLLTTFGNMMFMVRAVPDCLKMCSPKEWATVADRNDPRIAGNINGKSTLRTTFHVLNHGLRWLGEEDSDKALQDWIRDVYVKEWGLTAKSDKIIFGSG